MQLAAQNTRSLLEQSPAELDLRSMQNQSFESLTLSTDAWFRSEPFLESLRHYLDSMTQPPTGESEVESTGTSQRRNFAADSEAIRSRLSRIDAELDPNAPPEPQEVSEKSPSPDDDESVASHVQERGATQCDILYREGSMRLLRYHNEIASRFAEPLLICFALVNRPYILDLNEERSVVRRFLAAGFDVYMIDWGEPAEDDKLHLDDYVCDRLHHVVQFLHQHTGADTVNLLGYCMGGTLAAMYTALHPDRVRNLVLMAAPIDFSGDEGLLNVWTREGRFNVDQLIDRFGNCPGEFLKFVFQVMKPVQNFAEKQMRLYENLDDEAFLSHFAAVERWANDSVSVSGETFREFVKLLYQRNQLVRGELMLRNRLVELSALTCPVLLLIAEKDHLVPPSSTAAFSQFADAARVDQYQVRAGHVGLAVSRRAHEEMWPRAISWLADRSAKRRPCT